MEIKSESLEHAMIDTALALLKHGVPRKTRGFDCIEIPELVTVTIADPTKRYIFNPERKWNKYLGFAESLWIMNGLNSMDMVGMVVKNLYDFSDDGKFMRAGYGPRIRGFNSDADDYEYSTKSDRESTVDQLAYVIQLLKEQPNSRQAGITIHDPVKDCFNLDGTLKTTKDQPCSRLLHFQIVDGKLDLTTFMRANDFLWGFSAVNVFNFTMIQELVSIALNVPIGKYQHVINNLHYYANFKDRVEAIADTKPTRMEHYEYSKGYSLGEIDTALVYAYEQLSSLISSPNGIMEMTGVGIVDDMLYVVASKFASKDYINFELENPNVRKLFQK